MQEPDYLDTREFYELMYSYRMASTTNQENVINKFEAVKNFIREANKK